MTSLDEFYDTSAIAIGDKGFYSIRNVEEPEKRKVNYIIPLHIFYMIRRKLAESNLTDKISAREAIRGLCRQLIVRLNDEWRIAQASGKDKTQAEALGIHVT